MFPYQCDMTDISNIESMFKWIENHSDLGKLDICICNAGVAVGKSLTELTPDEMKQMMNINVISSSFCTQLSIKMMLKNGIDDGQIIFINRFVDLNKIAFFKISVFLLIQFKKIQECHSTLQLSTP